MSSEAATARIVDVIVDPLANIVVQLLALLASKGVIAKEEALACVASASAVLDDRRISEEDGDIGRDMLMKMVKLLDLAVEPERRLAAGMD